MSNSLTIQIDTRHHTIYIYLRPIQSSGVARSEKLGDGVMADFGKAGDLLGVELLGQQAVDRLFALVPKRKDFSPLAELTPKKDLLERLIA